MSEPRLTDAQQAAAITRAGESLSLQSGAGCGKTFVLARRFSELLIRSSAQSPLSRLAAVTFTDKAALEMNQRVRALLASRLAHSKGDDRRKLLAWIDELPEARISTIHGFCSSLLRRHALAAGLDPAFSVAADDVLTGALRTQAADTAVLEAIEQGQPHALSLMDQMSFEQAVEEVAALIARRGQIDWARWQQPEAVAEHWRKTQAAMLDAEMARLREELLASHALRVLADPGNPVDKLGELCSLVHALITEFAATASASTVRQMADLKVGNVGSVKEWGSAAAKKQAADAVRQVKELAKSLLPWLEDANLADERAAETVAALAGLAQRAEQLYAREKRRRGLLDFDDLLIHAERLLRERPEVARAMGSQLDQLLIDEAQDTDALQLRMLESLCGGIDDEAAARLFVVGDDKQSIYRFRGAQVEVFRDLCSRLGKTRSETLNISFRTHRTGVELVNHIFAELMDESYVPLAAHRTTAPPHPAAELLLAAPTEHQPLDSAEAAQNAQAAVAAERIAEMLANRERLVWDRDAQDWRPVRAGDIAILLTRMAASSAFERELGLRGVPYYVVAGSGFFQQQEVFDLLNALRAIDNPLDEIAVAGVLRSSLFGVDDNTLAQLAATTDGPWLDAIDHSDLADELSPGQLHSLQAARDILAELHARKDALGIDRLIDELLDATGYEAMLLGQFQGRRMVGNLRILRQRARAAQGQGLSLAQFIAQIDELVVAQSRHEQAAVAGEADDVVRIMTVHKAKGLEFPVVVLPDINAARQGSRDRLLIRDGWGLTCKTRVQDETGGELEPVSDELARIVESRDERDEDIRVLYVAMTRHEDYLLLAGADWRTQDGRFQRGECYLNMLDGVLGLSGLEETDTLVACGDGVRMRYRRVAPAPTQRQQRDRSPGRQMLDDATDAQQFARALTPTGEPAAPPTPLVGPVPLGQAGLELAATALGDFAHCPMQYRWSRELRVPEGMLARAKKREHASGRPTSGLDPAALGTVIHAVMERLDFQTPPDVPAVVARVVDELEIDPAAAPGILAELAPMLEAFQAHELWGQLASARQLCRELDFVLQRPRATIRGQIDLLYQDAGGAWHIVDYKSNRVSREGLAELAGHYRTQMLLYWLAARAHLGDQADRLADATLYFLRPGLTFTFADELSSAADELDELTRRLLAARRSGRFERHTGPACQHCRYRPCCDALVEPSPSG
jgi:ATP-dependent helicase/nuclease subunit A